MPDGPRYDDDFYAWTQHQAEVLRSLHVTDNRFDREHVAEEIEDLGKSERDAVRSQIRRTWLLTASRSLLPKSSISSATFSRSNRLSGAGIERSTSAWHCVQA